MTKEENEGFRNSVIMISDNDYIKLSLKIILN